MTETETATCTKVAFPSEAEAMVRLFEIALSPARYPGPKPVRSYRCSTCGAWHITRLRGLS